MNWTPCAPACSGWKPAVDSFLTCSCSFPPSREGWGGGQRTPQTIIRNGRDLADTPRGVKVIDLYGLSADQTRTQFPVVYQWLLDRVKPERDTNRDIAIRDNSYNVLEAPREGRLLSAREKTFTRKAWSACSRNCTTNWMPPCCKPTASIARPQATAPQAAQAWHGTLPNQVRAVAKILADASIALPQIAIEARFKGRGPWKKSLPRILDTLEALGRARREGTGWRR